MGECISREAAIEIIVVNSVKHFIDPEVSAEMIHGIKKLPAENVREIRKSNWFGGECLYCGFKPTLDYEYATVYDKRHGYAWNYCPNCGAEMEES